MSQTDPSHARPVRIAAGLLVPLVAFVTVLQTLGNATEALAVADALPLLWLLAYAVWRRRIEPVGVTALAGFAIALLLTIVLGGSPRPLELHRAVFPGIVGLACLISLVVGRPLLVIVAVRRRQAAPPTASHTPVAGEGARHALRVVTAIIGVTLTLDAAAQVTLAFTVSTSTFGIVSRIAGWAIVATGLAVVGLYARAVRARLRQGHPPAPPSPPRATGPDATATPGSAAHGRENDLARSRPVQSVPDHERTSRSSPTRHAGR